MVRDDVGRDPRSVPVTLFNASEEADDLARYCDMRVARVVAMLLSEPSDKILQQAAFSGYTIWSDVRRECR